MNVAVAGRDDTLAAGGTVSRYSGIGIFQEPGYYCAARPMRIRPMRYGGTDVEEIVETTTKAGLVTSRNAGQSGQRIMEKVLTHNGITLDE
nr:hypothetical protein CFP56_00842 [Quercus suber]